MSAQAALRLYAVGRISCGMNCMTVFGQPFERGEGVHQNARGHGIFACAFVIMLTQGIHGTT